MKEHLLTIWLAVKWYRSRYLSNFRCTTSFKI